MCVCVCVCVGLPIRGLGEYERQRWSGSEEVGYCGVKYCCLWKIT